MSLNYTDLSKYRSSTKDKSTQNIKTTDVNILLNRVRLDKKKTFKKNILFSLLLVGLVGMITSFFII